MDVRSYIRVYDGVLSPEHCKQIIDKYESCASSVEHHDTDLYKFDQLNLSQTPGLEGLAMAVAESLAMVYEDYFNAFGVREFVKIETFEDVRIMKYKKGTGQEFKTHVDVTDHDSASRYAIAIVYLNNNNGMTTFDKLDIGVEPKVGRVVVFPPFWMFPHSGTTPTDNDKYIMMTCLRYV